MTSSPQPRFLLYADGGARLLYAGADEAEYHRLCHEAAAEHAGALVGRRRTGPEYWEVRCYFASRPDDHFIAQRRHAFPYGLGWIDD